MQSVIVMPLDPQGTLFPFLKAITPQLKELFDRAVISVKPPFAETGMEQIERLESDDFFQVLIHQSGGVGEDFLKLYAGAVDDCPDDCLLHLCYPDRVAFALLSAHREQFRADMEAVDAAQTPLIFQRSEAAWETHPHNYRVIEGMVTSAGEFLFNRSLDFAWCHLAVQAGRLRQILPHIKNRDISMVAEIVLMLRDQIRTKEVDWLAWEDPFIYDREAGQLKQEREESLAETRKRLAYVIPMLRLLDEAAKV